MENSQSNYSVVLKTDWSSTLSFDTQFKIESLLLSPVADKYWKQPRVFKNLKNLSLVLFWARFWPKNVKITFFTKKLFKSILSHCYFMQKIRKVLGIIFLLNLKNSFWAHFSLNLKKIFFQQKINFITLCC